MKHIPNPTDVIVGRNVRTRRLSSGMSQGKLGEALGITFQQIQKYEKGANRIGSSRLWEISQILDVPIQSLFDGAGDNPDPEVTTVMDFVSSGQGMSLIKAFVAIVDPVVRQNFIALMKSIPETP